MKRLSDILTGIKVEELIGEADLELTDIQFDSRKVTTGSLFVATRGTVVEKGASAIVCEVLPTERPAGVTFVKVKDSSIALGQLASAWYDTPSSSLRLVGVTGTNGKTTIATLLYQLFTRLGYKCGLLSTVCNYVIDEAIPTAHTTEDALTINRLLAKMVEAGCSFAFMEVSSHAVDQHRIEGLVFEGGIFTNLTRDHLVNQKI